MASGVRAGKAFVIIEAIDKTGATLNKIGKSLKAFGAGMASMGRNLFMKTIFAATPVAFGLKAFMRFDDAMKKVEARSGGTRKEMEDLRNTAKKFGREVSFTASQVGELQAKLAQKGFNRGQINSMTGGVVNLALGAGEGKDQEQDITNAADLVSGTLRAFKLPAEDATHVADVFTAAVNNSNFTLEGLINGMSYAAPIARKMGLSLEETVGILSQMVDLNIPAETAGRSLRDMLTDLGDAAKRAALEKRVEQATGKVVKFTDEAGNLKKLPDIMFAVGEAMKNMGSADQAGLLTDIFGKQSVIGAATLSEGKNPFTDMMKVLSNVEGVAARTAQIMDSGLGGAWRRFTSALEGIAIEMGEALLPALVAVGDGFSNMSGIISSFIMQNQGVAIAILAVVAGSLALSLIMMILGPLISLVGTAFGVLGTVLTLVKVGFVMLGGVVTAVMGIITTVVTSPFLLIGGLIAGALALFTNFFGAVSKGFSSAFGFIGEKVSGLWSTVSTAFGGIMEAVAVGDFASAWDIAVLGMETTWLQLVDTIKGAWGEFTNWLANTYTDMNRNLSNIVVDLQRQSGVIGETIDLLTWTDSDAIEGRRQELEAKAKDSNMLKEKGLVRVAESGLEDYVRANFENLNDAEVADMVSALQWNTKESNGLNNAHARKQSDGTYSNDNQYLVPVSPEAMKNMVKEQGFDWVANAQATNNRIADDQIAKNNDEVTTAQAERQAAIDEKRKALEDRIAKMREDNEKAKAKREADNAKVEEALLKKREATQIETEDLTKGLQMQQDEIAQNAPALAEQGGANLDPQTLDTLEFGSVETARRAYENQLRSAEGIDEIAKEQLAELEKINENLNRFEMQNVA